MSKSLFKEQFHERKTLRRLMREIGPVYPEFDLDAIKRWVHRCAPHVWNIYRTNNLDTLDGFLTAEFVRDYASGGPKRVSAKGETLVFEKILKVHPLGIYVVAEGQLPSGIELMLRLEEKVQRVTAIAPNQATNLGLLGTQHSGQCDTKVVAGSSIECGKLKTTSKTLQKEEVRM